MVSSTSSLSMMIMGTVYAWKCLIAKKIPGELGLSGDFCVANWLGAAAGEAVEAQGEG